jgi:hypothetical protein
MFFAIVLFHYFDQMKIAIIFQLLSKKQDTI